MALKKVSIKVTEELFKSNEAKEAVKLEEEFIKEAYEKGVALTKIAEKIDNDYKEQFTERVVTYPIKGKKERGTKKVKPTVRIEHIRECLNNLGILKEADKKKIRKD